MKILIPNIGSTSLKWRLFDFSRGEERLLHKGGFERVTDYPAAIGSCLGQLKAAGAIGDEREIAGVGFKTIIAKGISGCVRIDETVLRAMEAYNGLAPAHNPPYIKGIRLFAQRMPGVPLIALFETAFYQFAPEAAMRYAVPESWHAAGVRRWGFHGASHKFIAERSAELLGREDLAERTRELYSGRLTTAADGAAAAASPKGVAPPLRVISCHLGGSSSVTGILNGVAIGNSFGMTPQSGLPQNNRVGDLDSSAVPHVMRALGLSVEEVEQQMARASGLQGLSGLSNDIRDIERAAADGHPDAALALEVYVAAVRHWIGAYLVALNGADALVFTAGIGENSASMRARICGGLDQLGIVVDKHANTAARAQESLISAARSRVKVFVIPTNEELVVARETRRQLEAGTTERHTEASLAAGGHGRRV